MKKVVVLFIDAFSQSYIDEEYAPFLSRQRVYSLTPVFGFKQLTAAFTGLDPFSTSMFTEYYYDSLSSPYKWTRILPPPFLSTMDSLVKSPVDVFSRWIFHRGRLTSRLVPLEMAQFFSMDKNPFPTSSPIVSLLQEKKLSYRFVFFPEVKTNAEAFNLLQTLSDSDRRPDFLLVHFPELDPVTHKWGTKSSRTKNLVRKIDLIIAKSTEMFKDSYLIVFSDHGMFDVRGSIDVAAKINALDCRRKEFAVFLDAIMARFWIFKGSAFGKIVQALSKEAGGTIIVRDNPQRIDKFGHIMFLCSPGYVISPNYYDLEQSTAMHGYAPSAQMSSLDGIFLTNNLPTQSTNKKLVMTDIAPILKQTIELL